MALHWIDISIIGIIALSVITGLIRGFVKELIALCIWVVAIWLAYNYAHSLDSWLQAYIHDKTARAIAGFVLILIGILIVGGIANNLIGIVLKRSGLSSTDRILGMGFGFVRGVFIVSLIIVVIKMTSLSSQDYIRESILYAKFDPIVERLSSYMPKLIKQVKALDKNDFLSGTVPVPIEST